MGPHWVDSAQSLPGQAAELRRFISGPGVSANVLVGCAIGRKENQASPPPRVRSGGAGQDHPSSGHRNARFLKDMIVAGERFRALIRRRPVPVNT
jgi:hypothetical protein